MEEEKQEKTEESTEEKEMEKNESDENKEKESAEKPEKIEEPIEEIEEKESAEKPEKKETKKLLVLIAVVVGIFIIFFAVGYYFKMDSGAEVVTIDDLHQKNMEGEESDVNYMYNGFSFVYINSMWYTQLELKDALLDLPLHYGPRQVEDIKITGTIDESFMRKGIFVTFNPTEDNMKYVALAASELTLSMAKGMGIKPIAACDRNETDIEDKKEEVRKACEGIPIVDCESGKPAVYLLQEEPAQIEMKGNCVVVQGAGMNLTQAVDRLLYEWYGVMDYTRE